MNLRPYQAEAIAQLREGFKTHQRQLLVLPTGAGKTITFAAMASAALAKGRTVLVLTDRLQLLEQAFDALYHLRPSNIRKNPYAPLTIGMVETAARRILPYRDLIIIDEAHKGNFFKVLDRHPNTRVIGATATPLHPRIPDYYTNTVEPVQIPELIDNGYLSPVAPYQIESDLKGLRTRNGDYTEASQYAAFNTPRIYGQALEHYRALGQAPALYFCANIQHAKDTAAAFREAGIRAASVTSDDPHRDSTLAAFHKGEIDLITNCGILTTGYDHPPIRTIGILRATQSIPLWLQMCGRGSRIFPGKTDFTIIDHGNNHTRIGRWDAPRTWDNSPEKDKDPGAPPIRICPKCRAAIPAQSRTCPFCNTTMPTPPTPPPPPGVATLVSLTPDLTGRLASTLSIAELIQAEREHLLTTPQVHRILRSRGMAALQHYARIKGYKPGWAMQNIRFDKTPIDWVL